MPLRTLFGEEVGRPDLPPSVASGGPCPPPTRRSSRAAPDETSPRRTAYAVPSLEAALSLAATLDDEVYIAGGGSIYDQSWQRLTDLDLTEVHATAEGSVHFPSIDPKDWIEVDREPREGFDFVHYRRR